MDRFRNSGQKHSYEEMKYPDDRQGKKQLNFFLTFIIVLLPIFIISGLALSSYLTRPPELPPQEQGKTGGVAEGVNKGNDGETDEEISKGTEEEISEETIEDTTGKMAEEAAEDKTEELTDKQEEPLKPPKQYKENFYTFVVTGMDFEGYHTDTIMVVSLDTAARKANLISVPRDSQVDVPREYKKINTAYAYGGTKGLKRELESILGFSPHYTIRVDLEAFPKLVDAVGCVEFDVPQDMDYDDPSQKLNIHLVKGPQLLDGDKALQLVRFRGYINADLGRMEIQQKFLKALANEVLSPANIIHLDKYLEIFTQDIKTDIGLRDMQWFVRQVIKLNPETDITVETLPQVDDGGYYRGQHYLYLLPEGVVDMVNRTVNPYTTDISLDDVNIVRIEDIDYSDLAHKVMRKMYLFTFFKRYIFFQ